MGEASTLTAGSPKLLELDKADVQAVRSFLPGKVLGRTAALLALVVLVLGFAGTVDAGLERFLGFPLEPRWLKYALLIGIPVLIVGAQIVAEWQAERKRRQAQALAVKTEAGREDYFRIGPYLDTADDRAKFDRADRIHEKVLDWRNVAGVNIRHRFIPPRKHLALHAQKLALKPRLQILRTDRRPMLGRLEQAHRSALADHVPRNAGMGLPVQVSESRHKPELRK